MAKPEWFRNEDWSPTVEAHFFQKLARARDKAQYLKLQAYHLTQRHPEVALTLLERYFALGEHFFDADALVVQATA